MRVVCGTDLRPKTPDPTMRIDEGRGAGSGCIALEQDIDLRSNPLSEVMQGKISGGFPSYRLIRVGGSRLGVDLTSRLLPRCMRLHNVIQLALCMGKQYPAICANDLHAIQNLVPPANEAFSCLPAAGADQQQGSGTSEIQVYSHPPPSSVPQGRKTYTDPATTEHRCATNPPPRPPTTTPPPTPPTKPFRKAPWIISGLAVYSFTAYGFYLYRIYNRQVAASQHLQVPDNVLDRYERTARDYDSEVELAERAMWMGRLRKRLTKRAYGDVLEVSVGTGRNAAYYDLAKCRSVTMLDQSGEMVEIARGKFRGMFFFFFSFCGCVYSTGRPFTR